MDFNCLWKFSLFFPSIMGKFSIHNGGCRFHSHVRTPADPMNSCGEHIKFMQSVAKKSCQKSQGVGGVGEEICSFPQKNPQQTHSNRRKRQQICPCRMSFIPKTRLVAALWGMWGFLLVFFSFSWSLTLKIKLLVVSFLIPLSLKQHPLHQIQSLLTASLPWLQAYASLKSSILAHKYTNKGRHLIINSIFFFFK